MFASKTPRDLNRDPVPWVHHGSRYRTQAMPSAGFRQSPRDYLPRPEYDHPQHNEHNPILVAFREDSEATHNWPRALLIQDWLDVLGGFANFWDSCAVDIDAVLDSAAPAHIAHARRVLTRLAGLVS